MGDALRDAEAVVDVGQVLEKHNEFVAAEARHRVAGAADPLQPPGDLHQQAVAGAVAEGVVDELEAVEVEEEHGEVAAAAAAAAPQVWPMPRPPNVPIVDMLSQFFMWAARQ